MPTLPPRGTMNATSLWAQYRDELANDPLLVLGLTAALVALATTPLAFAILGRLDWFKARRGRVLQRPAFSSIVVGMMLVMGIPAIFAAMVLKSRSFDKNRYEFDPNRTWSVLEQGRGLETCGRPTRPSSRRCSGSRWSGRTWSRTSRSWMSRCWPCGPWRGRRPAVAQRIPGVLQSLAGVRKSVGLDGPQQLLDYTAPPVDLRAAGRQCHPAGPAVRGDGPSLRPSPPPARRPGRRLG